MSEKKWSQHHESCLICGTTEKPHRARGFCQSCYFRYYKALDAMHELVMAISPVLQANRIGVSWDGASLILRQGQKVLLDWTSPSFIKTKSA